MAQVEKMAFVCCIVSVSSSTSVFMYSKWSQVQCFISVNYFFAFYIVCLPTPCVIAAVANTDCTTDTQGTILFGIFPPLEVVFLLIISRLGSNVAAGWPFWLQSELQEPQGAQRLLSSQCRSCGAGSSYIWLLGLCWQPCWSGYMMMNE